MHRTLFVYEATLWTENRRTSFNLLFSFHVVANRTEIIATHPTLLDTCFLRCCPSSFSKCHSVLPTTDKCVRLLSVNLTDTKLPYRWPCPRRPPAESQECLSRWWLVWDNPDPWSSCPRCTSSTYDGTDRNAADEKSVTWIPRLLTRVRNPSTIPACIHTSMRSKSQGVVPGGYTC